MQYSSSSESSEASASNSPRYQSRATEAVTHGAEVSSDIDNTSLVTLQIQSRTSTPIPWSTGLFDCFSDIPNCCMTCWCPCITFGQIAEILDKGSTSCGENGGLYVIIACAIGCPCYYSCFYRSQLRQQFKLRREPQTPCSDCFVHCCCELCALCQEYRQLKHLGHDMSTSIGRHRNSERRNGELAMSSTLAAPAIQEEMSR